MGWVLIYGEGGYDPDKPDDNLISRTWEDEPEVEPVAPGAPTEDDYFTAIGRLASPTASLEDKQAAAATISAYLGGGNS